MSSGDPDQPASPSTAPGGEQPSSEPPSRVLVVAHRTAATPKLLAAVEARASRSPCVFTLLVPRPYWDPDTEDAAATLELAIPLLERASGQEVRGVIGATDPLAAVREALDEGPFDEVIISTLPSHVSRWLRRDVPHRVAQLGPPVTVVTAEASQRSPAAPVTDGARDSI